jgi:hypothetical protein
VAARVRELIHWGLHDIARFDSIHEMIFDRIRKDIRRSNVNSASVGVKIFGRLLENVRELNLNLTNALTSAISLLFKTERQEFLDLAMEGTSFILAHSLRLNSGPSIERIVTQFLKLTKREEIREFAYCGLAVILEHTAVDWHQLGIILDSVKDIWTSDAAAHGVVVALAHSAIPVTLPSFVEVLFKFFDRNSWWTQIEPLAPFVQTIFKECRDNCAPPLFRMWLERLPPIGTSGHFRPVTKVAVALMEEVPPQKLLSHTQIDSLTTILVFVVRLPGLMPDATERAAILDECLTLVHAIGTHFAASELARLAHHQLWVMLPGGENAGTIFDEETALIIFKFAEIFEDAIATAIDKKMVTDSLRRISVFLTSFSAYSAEILSSVLSILKLLGRICPAGKLGCLAPFLLALQEEVNNKPCCIQLQTLIMCAMKDVFADGPAAVKSYVESIAKARIQAEVSLVDIKLDFVNKYFPKIRRLRSRGAQRACSEGPLEGNYLFDKVKINDFLSETGDRGKALCEFTAVSPGEEEDDNESRSEHMVLDASLPRFTYAEDDGEGIAPIEENVSPEEKELLRKAAFEAVSALSFEWRSEIL